MYSNTNTNYKMNHSIIVKKYTGNLQKFDGYEFINDKKYPQNIESLTPIFIGKKDIINPPTLCCGNSKNIICNNVGRFKSNISDSRWFCDSHILHNLRKYEFKHDYILSEKKCSICYDILDPSLNIQKTICGHIFHEYCLDKWKNISLTCPLCRTGLLENDFHANHTLFLNHYLLCNSLHLHISFSDYFRTYLNLVFKRSEKMQDDLKFLETLSISKRIDMYNKVGVAINNLPSFHLTGESAVGTI